MSESVLHMGASVGTWHFPYVLHVGASVGTWHFVCARTCVCVCVFVFVCVCVCVCVGVCVCVHVDHILVRTCIRHTPHTHKCVCV